jgi:hypothetical protein
MAIPMLRNTLIAFLVIAAGTAAWLGSSRLRSEPAQAAVPTAAPAAEAVVDVSARPAAAPPPRLPAGPQAKLPPSAFPEEQDRRDPEQAKLEGIQKLDAQFMAERVVPQWSMEQERKISASFSPEALKLANAPAPLAREASCRSTTCKITATYASEMDAQVAHLNLMASIPNLNRSVMGMLQGPDGAVQLVVYASASDGAAPPALRH